ncbi:MAG: hypothetical protein AAFP10_06110 [Pseudomonadota bacterium]
MATINFRYQYSRSTLGLILLIGVLLLGLLAWQWDLVYDIYFRDQLTRLGWLINGAIVVLFLTGMAHIVLILWHYRHEEAGIAQFLRNLQQRPERPLRGIEPVRLIAQRYDRLQALYDARQPIDQSALAATLMASESIRQGVPKFVNNTLILTGVFGTIVSLSIALIGASETLENAVSATGMGMVIHGMSTALSTTITAIVCYFYFAFFFARVNDAQTNLVGAIEQITTLHLLPRFQVDTEHVLYEFASLLRSLQGLAEQMQQTQTVLAESEYKVLAAIQGVETTRIQQSLDVITQQLRVGFRLRDDE